MSDGIAQNVRVGVVGGIFTGPATSTVPANHAAAVTPTLKATLLAAGFREGGYVSKDGVTQSIGSTITRIVAWGGDVVRVVKTEENVTYKYKLIERNEATLKEYYGEDATAQEVQLRGEQPQPRRRVIVVRDGNVWAVIVIPHSIVTERGDIQYYGEDAEGYEVTVEALPDDSGVKAYIYFGSIAYAEPTITDVTPAVGVPAGAELVEITGTGFLGVAFVRFGGVNALAFNVDSATKITAFTPPHPAGTVDVTVRTSGGLVIAHGEFEYAT